MGNENELGTNTIFLHFYRPFWAGRHPKQSASTACRKESGISPRSSIGMFPLQIRDSLRFIQQDKLVCGLNPTGRYFSHKKHVLLGKHFVAAYVTRYISQTTRQNTSHTRRFSNAMPRVLCTKSRPHTQTRHIAADIKEEVKKKQTNKQTCKTQ